jgi:hypothetical protein
MGAGCRGMPRAAPVASLVPAAPSGRLTLVARMAAVVVAVALAPTATAFESLPGGPHDEITAAAAREAGLPEEVVPALVEAVRAVDFRESQLEPGGEGLDRIDATDDYRPEHHCDRVPPTDDLAAFQATVDHVANRSQLALAAIQADDPDAAVRHLGEVLHAVQDCLSHSNAVDLDDPEAVVAAINGRAAAPEGLRLTAFEPGADDPESPEGDDYPHGEFAKDADDKNAESRLLVAENETKFEAARTLAVKASILALQDVLRHLDPAQVERLADAQGGGQPLPRVGLPGLAPAYVLLALGVAAVTLGRRR